MATFRSGPFKGVDVRDSFARAALDQSPVIVDVGAIAWPASLAPKAAALGSYAPGAVITGPLSVRADVLIILYTELETRALLDVFTQNSEWTPARRKSWNGYGHNFAKFKPLIEGISGDAALEAGLFGYLSAVTIGTQTVVLFKSELHPKQNGPKLPFVPVMTQLVSEIAPKLVISTGTAGAVGGVLNCGDVAITRSARFKCEVTYPNEPAINAISADRAELTNAVTINPAQLDFAAANLTRLSLPGLNACYADLQKLPGYSFVRKNTAAPAIYVTDSNPVPGPEPMDIVSADYLTVDDDNDSEGLQALGIMNDTDDAFAFYAIDQIGASKPAWVSVRNASEPQIVAKPFPAGTSSQTIIDDLKSTAGTIYGIYQYCTTLNSAFACWGIVAGM
jgi:hypothetical protein